MANNDNDGGLTARVSRMVEPMKLELQQITRTQSILNANQVQKIFNTTNKKYIYQRPGKGGGAFNYVRASYVRRTLDSIFGFNWNFEILTPDEVAFQMAVMTGYITLKGRITGRVKVDGQWVEIYKEQYGRAEVKFLTTEKLDDDGNVVMENYYDKRAGKQKQRPVKVRKIDDFTGKPIPLDFGNDMKAATSDALKKAASQFGIAADVYDPDEFIPYEIAGSDEADVRAKNAKQMAADAKKKTNLIDAPATTVSTRTTKEAKPDEPKA